MGTLTQDDQTALHAVLSDCLSSEDDLDLLLFKIGQSLARVAKSGTLPIRVLATVRAADSRGWVGRLIREANREWPGRPELQRLRGLVPVEPPPRTVAGDLASYDMHGQLKIIRRAKQRGMLVGVAVRDDVGEGYLSRLCERVVSDLQASSRDTPLKLDRVHKKGAAAAAALLRLVKTLSVKPLVVRVSVPPGAASEVEPLMAELARESTKWDHHLVLILIADESDIPALPAAVDRLDAPAIEEDDVTEWVECLAAPIPDWPYALTKTLIARIWEPHIERSDWTMLYDELESINEELHSDFVGMVAAIADGPNAD